MPGWVFVDVLLKLILNGAEQEKLFEEAKLATGGSEILTTSLKVSVVKQPQELLTETVKLVKVPTKG